MISFNYVNMSGVELFNQRGRKASESPNKWLVKTFMTHRTLILRLVVWRSWVMTQRIGILKFFFEISGSALNFGLILPPTSLWGTFFMFRNPNLLNNKEPDYRRSKKSNTGDQNLVGSVFDVREVLIIVGSLITDQHCPKKESIRYGHKPVSSESFWCLQLSHSNSLLSSHYTHYVQY